MTNLTHLLIAMAIPTIIAIATISISRWAKANQPKQTSSKDGERLTDDEIKTISKSNPLLCPDCETELLEGPSGGLSTNALCPNCGSEFNITTCTIQLIGERISPKGPRPTTRQHLYGPRKLRR